MNTIIYSPLQIREIFHLEFLRWFSRKVNADQYVLKGGVNLRLFFQSPRYSEDMDLDVRRVGVDKIKKVSMAILASKGFSDTLKFFGVEEVVAPDITHAKQTDTTQRFKVHLITAAGQDLFTKIEFSRRGAKEEAVIEPVSVGLLRLYKMPPILVPHYGASTAVRQKIQALARRSVLQTRDIFDLFLLSSQLDASDVKHVKAGKADTAAALNNVFQAETPLFHSSVVAYFALEDQKVYSSQAAWDEVKLKVSAFLEECQNAGE